MADQQEEPGSALTAHDREILFEACTREAKRIGGDERSAEYFFVRAQSSRVWCSNNGTVTVADMAIEDWCNAIAWSAPGMGRPPKRAPARPDPNSLSRAESETQARKKPRSGANSKRSSNGAA